MAENKELWRGAGLWLDFRNINDGDRAKVERRLDEIGELKAQIVFLQKLLRTYLYAIDEIFDDLKKQVEERRHQYRQQGISPESATSRARQISREFTERGKRFELWLKGKLKYLTDMIEIEPVAQQVSKTDVAGPDVAKTIASKELGQIKHLTAAQRVWVFHFLLTTTGMNEDNLQKTDVARCIVAATGSEPGKVYKHVLDPEQETPKATYRDLTAVRSWFEKLKMTDMVKKVDRERKIFEGSGT